MSSAGTATPARRGRKRPPARVLLLSESAGLAAVLGGLLHAEERLTRAGSLREAAEGGGLAGADAVVLDTQADGRLTDLEHLRQLYGGPLVVLVERGAAGGHLPPDDARTVLVRPFAAEDLGAVLGLPPPARLAAAGPLPPTADRPSGRELVRIDAASARQLALRPGHWPAVRPLDHSRW